MKKKPNYILISLFAAIVVMVAVACVMLFSKEGGNITNQVIPAESYLNSPNNFVGNTYRINAVITSQITTTPNGRVLLVQDRDSGLHIPVLVPYTNNTTFHPLQFFILEVVNKDGILVVTQIAKS